MSRAIIVEKHIPVVKFFFEANQYIGLIDSMSEFNNLMFFYDFDTLKKAKVQIRTLNPEIYTISFGFYGEYNGKLTLGEWIKNNNLQHYFKKKYF